MWLLVGAVVGLVVGGSIGWLAARTRSTPQPLDARLEHELRQQISQTQTDLSSLREQLSGATESLAAARTREEVALRRVQELKAEHEQSQKEALARLEDAFKLLSNQALKEAQPQLVTMAEQAFQKLHLTAVSELDKRQIAIANLVKPLEENLNKYQSQLQRSEKEHATTLGQVAQQLQNLTQKSQELSQETLQLRLILSNNQARGKWGEETLRRVVEAAGLSAHCDFVEQTQAGDGKPDLIVKLPGDRVIVVDAKVPDLEFVNALANAESSRRGEVLSDYAAKLRLTVKMLADRDYPQQFPKALDHVVLFLPAESLFSAALEGDPDLIVWAASKQVMLATPASFIALLRAVSFSWQQHDQTENARAIADHAQELFERVCIFSEHLERIRAGLERATKAFNEAVGSYERYIIPSGERLVKFGAGLTGRNLAELPPLDTTLRLPAANGASHSEMSEQLSLPQTPDPKTLLEGK